MSLFEELDAMFPSHTHYYVVNLPTMNEALEMCARICVGNPQLLNYNGQMILASPSGLGSQISWLNEIPRIETPAPAEISPPTK